MAEQEENKGRVPEWIVTYGDMMTLLLTFFIMLAAMSQIKKEDNKYQEVVDSLRKQFGYDETVQEIPGDFQPRNSAWRLLTNLGRARRKDTASGGNDVQAPVGERLKVAAVRPGRSTIVGAAIYFDEDAAELPESGKEVLESLAPAIIGKSQKIEIRGHTSRKPLPDGASLRDHWGLAYQRCHNTMQYLVELGVEPNRLRLTSAAAYEPLNNALAPALRKRNARVEVFLWDEQVEDFSGQRSANQEVEGGE